MIVRAVHATKAFLMLLITKINLFQFPIFPQLLQTKFAFGFAAISRLGYETNLVLLKL